MIGANSMGQPLFDNPEARSSLGCFPQALLELFRNARPDVTKTHMGILEFVHRKAQDGIGAAGLETDAECRFATTRSDHKWRGVQSTDQHITVDLRSRIVFGAIDGYWPCTEVDDDLYAAVRKHFFPVIEHDMVVLAIPEQLNELRDRHAGEECREAWVCLHTDSPLFTLPTA